MENTHPFTRELWGRYWTYAHNGQLSNYESLSTGYRRPVGETDSELVFCWLLNQIETQFPDCPHQMEFVFRAIAKHCDLSLIHI